jgi:hypothetical protein
MWEREGGGRMVTTTMMRGGRGYRAVVAMMAGVLWRCFGEDWRRREVMAVDVPQLGVTTRQKVIN